MRSVLFPKQTITVVKIIGVLVVAITGIYAAYLFNSDYAYSGYTAMGSSGAPAGSNTFIGNFYKGTNFEALKVSGVSTSSINYDWGAGTPYKAVGRNDFSANWTGNFTFDATATYRFVSTYDDGLRLYIDGIAIIDDWKAGEKRTTIKDITVNAGLHTIRVDYFEKLGKASVAVSWSPVTQPPSPQPSTVPSPMPSSSPTASPTLPPATSPSPSPIASMTPPPPGSCWPTELPVGAIAGQAGPVFCSIVNPGLDTSVSAPGSNTWLDEFNHGLSFAGFSNTKYQVFENVGNYLGKTQHWLHNNHWMVDIAPDPQTDPNNDTRVGGAMIRPDRTFKFENGKLVIETDYAAGIVPYDTGAWGEIVVTTAPAPTQLRSAGLYAYDMFPGSWTLGLRMQPDRHTTAALMDNTTRGELEGGRPWEISFFQVVGQTVFGGAPFGGLENYWRLCSGTDPDAMCRDRFRLELTATTFTVYVNGVKYFEQTGMPPLPDELLNGDLYIYLASVTWRSPASTLRYHWDHFAVNPSTPPTAAPGFVATP